jgi:hypothetical protein
MQQSRPQKAREGSNEPILELPQVPRGAQTAMYMLAMTVTTKKHTATEPYGRRPCHVRRHRKAVRPCITQQGHADTGSGYGSTDVSW